MRDRATSAWPLLRIVQWVVVIGLVFASFGADFAGHAGLSWAIDAVTVAVYFGLRRVRR